MQYLRDKKVKLKVKHMNIEQIKELAKNKANETYEQGSEEWNALYYGYIYGVQDYIKVSQKDTKSKHVDFMHDNVKEKHNERMSLEEFGFMESDSSWDECTCLDCGHTWNIRDDENHNFTFCYMCLSDNIGGEYWKDKPNCSKFYE